MGRFTDLYGTALKKYADFSGRACRAEACAFLLTNTIIINTALIIGWILVFGGAVAESNVVAVLGALLFLFGGIFSLAVLVPSIALTTRRLHDVNQSGWLQLLILLNFIPFVNWIITIGFIVVLYCLPGTEGDNNYGPVSEKY